MTLTKELAGGHRLYIDDEGFISIANAPRNSTPQSRNLIRSLINSEFTIIIRESTMIVGFQTGYDADSWSNASNSKKGSGGTIYMNFSEAGRIGSKSFGYTEDSPFFICLGHELIHAERAARGVMIPMNKTVREGGPYGDDVLREDYATIGLMFNKPGDFTENMLRKEHGFPLRTIYRALP